MATAATTLTEGQLYDEANHLMFLMARGCQLSQQQLDRLASLEAEFEARHTAALAKAEA